MKEQVSVIIPTKNMEKYISKCLLSILNSVYSNFEVICIDFGSTDYTIDIINKFVEKDSRVRLLFDKDGNAATARNVGIENCKGEFLAFVDCDDWISPLMIEKLVSIAKVENAEIVCCGYFEENEANGHIIEKIKNFSVLNIGQKTISADLSKIALGQCTLEVWSKLYKTSFIKNNRIWFDSTNGINGEDVLFNFMAFMNYPKVITIEEPLYYHLIRNFSLANGNNKKLSIRFITIIDILLKYNKEKSLNAISGISQLMVSLFIQDAQDVGTKEHIIKTMNIYTSNNNLKKMWINALFSKYSSIKRRILILLVTLKFYKIVYKIFFNINSR